MTRTKLLTKVARIDSVLSKDINKLHQTIYIFQKKCRYYKNLIKQLDKLFKIMLKDGRLTKSELSKYHMRRNK